jgi:hypothetical protein
MCLSCGFDGAAIQSDSREHGWQCPRCNADLYARPPRSYAELEGLNDPEPRPAPTLRPRAAMRGRHVTPLQGPLSLTERRGPSLAAAIMLALALGAAIGGLALWALDSAGLI